MVVAGAALMPSACFFALEDVVPVEPDGGPDVIEYDVIVPYDINSPDVRDAAFEGGGDAGDAQTDASPCQANLLIDPNNCGRCSHSCLGATCTSGLCTPATFSDTYGTPHGIALDTSLYVYWTDSMGYVWRQPRTFTSLTSATYVGYYGPAGGKDTITVDSTGSYVYIAAPGLADAGAIAYASTISLGGATNVLASYQGSPAGIAVDTTYAYWTTLSSSLRYAAKTQLDASVFVESIPSAVETFGLTSDSTNLYWTDIGTGAVNACSRPSCLSEHTVTAASARYLAVSGTTVYFATTVPAAIMSCNITSCPSPTTITTLTTGTPYGVAADSLAVYFTVQNDGGTVQRCALPSCTGGPLVLARNVGTPNLIAVDTQYVYWTNSNPNTINRVAK
jgi:hypothetical protein